MSEEKEADQKLAELAQQINVEAAKGEAAGGKSPAKKPVSKGRRVT